jgi:hypothetical protein
MNHLISIDIFAEDFSHGDPMLRVNAGISDYPDGCRPFPGPSLGGRWVVSEPSGIGRVPPTYELPHWIEYLGQGFPRQRLLRLISLWRNWMAAAGVTGPDPTALGLAPWFPFILPAQWQVHLDRPAIVEHFVLPKYRDRIASSVATAK